MSTVFGRKQKRRFLGGKMQKFAKIQCENARKKFRTLLRLQGTLPTATGISDIALTC